MFKGLIFTMLMISVFLIVQPVFALTLQSAQKALEEKNYEVAAKEFLLLATENNAEAQYMIGWMMNMGLGFEQSPTKALVYFQKAANNDNIKAMNEIGYFYLLGYESIGLEKDAKKAIKWFEKSANKGNLRAQLTLGNIFSHNRFLPSDYKESHKWFSMAAKQESSSALYKLAKIYESGLGVEEHKAKALKYFLESADLGNENSKYRIALIYEKGSHGLKKDLQKAFQIYKEIAVKPFTTQREIHPNYLFWARERLGTLYLKGKGTIRDNVLAHMWLNIANTKKPSDHLTEKINTIEKNMTPEEIREALKRARQCIDSFSFFQNCN